MIRKNLGLARRRSWPLLTVLACGLGGLALVDHATAADESWRVSGNQNQTTAGQPAPSGGAATYPNRSSVVRPVSPVRPVQTQNGPNSQTVPPQQQRAPAGVQPAAGAPFQLSPQEQKYVEQVLTAWEYYGNQIKTFDSKFVLRTYDSTFQTADGGAPQPKVSQGILKYKKPDQGLFEIEGDRPEKWVSDGKAFYQFKYDEKQLVEYQLPPESQGQALEDGPIPFVFGSSAEKLKQRYWVKPLAPPAGQKDQIWLKIYPRRRQDAAEFRETDLILSTKDLTPMGVLMYSPNGQTKKSFTFFETKINDSNLFGFLKGDPFSPKTPSGWTRVVERPEPAGHPAGHPAAK